MRSESGETGSPTVQLAYHFRLEGVRSDPGGPGCLSVQLAHYFRLECMRSESGRTAGPVIQFASHFRSSVFSKCMRSDPFPVQLAYTRSDPCPFQLAYYLWSFPVFGWNALLLPVFGLHASVLVLLHQNSNSPSGATATSGAVLVTAGLVAELP